MRPRLFLLLLLLLPAASAYNDSGITRDGFNLWQYGNDINLRHRAIWNGSFNGTNFLDCYSQGKASSWNNSWFDCIALGGAETDPLSVHWNDFATAVHNNETDSTALSNISTNIQQWDNQTDPDAIHSSNEQNLNVNSSKYANASMWWAGLLAPDPNWNLWYNTDKSIQLQNNSDQEARIAGKMNVFATWAGLLNSDVGATQPWVLGLGFYNASNPPPDDDSAYAMADRVTSDEALFNTSKNLQFQNDSVQNKFVNDTFTNKSETTTNENLFNTSKNNQWSNDTFQNQLLNLSFAKNTNFTACNNGDFLIWFANLTASCKTPSGGSGFTVANSPLYSNGVNIYIQQSNSSANGFLSSTEWGTFNGKQAALTTNDVYHFLAGDQTWRDVNQTVSINTSQVVALNNTIDERVNLVVNLSNITMITANGSMVATYIPDGLGNITNLTGSGGITLSWQ